MTVTHAFTNPKADGGDSTITRPSDWNAGHLIGGTFLGYNTIGGTEETATLNRFIGKSFTPTTSGLLLAVAVYTREITDGLQSFAGIVHEDSSGALGKMLAISLSPQVAFTNNATFGDGSTTSIARWITIPLALELTGGTTYWGGILIYTSTANTRLFYDGSGTDRRYDSTGSFGADGGRYTQTDTTRKYSMRFLFLG